MTPAEAHAWEGGVIGHGRDSTCDVLTHNLNLQAWQ